MFNTKSITFLASILLIGGQAIFARQLTTTEALSIAKKNTDISVLRNSRKSGELKLVATEKSGDLNTVYIFSTESGGYVITSADDIGAPVLGYSDTGIFDANNLPENISSWIKGYSDEIAAALKAGASSYSFSRATDYPAIAPLMTTRWDQTSPYNNLCPLDNGSRCPTGCTATAVAQVMKHHNWPVTGVGTHSYKWNGQTLSFDYSKTTFEWDKMLDSYESVSTTAQKNAVARLMYAVGVGAEMQYAKSASGAYSSDAARALIENFNYDKGINYLQRKYYNLDTWIDMIYGELAENRPVEYDGYNDGAGHSFVVDGYRSGGYFHLNWGWSGMSNGYFLLTALDPQSQGVGGSTSGYNADQGAIFGIKKAEPDSDYASEVYFSGDFATKKETYTRNENVDFADGTIAGMYYLQSIFPVTLNPGIKLISEQGEEIYLWQFSNAVTLKPRSGYTNMNFSCSSFPTSGTYTVEPVYSVGDIVKDMKVAIGKSSRLKVVCTPSSLTFSEANELPQLSIESFGISGPSNCIYYGKDSQFSAVVHNNGSEFYGNLRMVAMKDGKVAGKMPNIAVNLRQGESKELNWIGKFTPGLAKGAYSMYIIDSSERQIGDAIEVEVKDVPSGPIKVYVSDCRFTEKTGEISNSSLEMVPVVTNELEFEATFGCTSGLWNAVVYAWVFPPEGGASLCDAGDCDVILAEGESWTYKFKKNLTLEPNSFYFIQFYGYNNRSAWGDYPGFINDENGKSKKFSFYITPEAGVEIVEVDKDITVTPNPADSYVTISTSNEIKSITFYAINGSELMTIKCDATSCTETVDVSNMPTGNHIARVVTTTGTVITRIIKR